ncbi:MAG TPA: glycosyltransferase family 4 protein [Terrimicrobiaceae bacterium]|nr:glycosyltransferase family 4 protein [Terrimicrobiaceae bacterium]
MRVFEIGMHWFPEGGGGADRYFYGLVSELTHHDCALKAFVFGEGKSDPGSHVRFLGKRNQSLRERLLKLRKGVKEELARESRPALIASHFSLYVFPLLDFFWRHPHVVHFHGPWADESAAEGESSRAVYFKQTIERVTYATARRFIVLSKAFRDVLVTRYRIREDRIDIVPGGVQADAFKTGLSRAEARERLGWPKDRIILLTVRRLARRMGLENFIEAIGQLREKEPTILAVLAGTGPLADELAALVERKNLQEHVKLAGFVPDADLPVAYRAADASVVPSIALEGFGLIVPESLAAGTPAIVTPVGGLPEAVSALSKDLILDGSSPAQIADGLAARLAALERLPSESACQAYAKDNFDWPVIANKVIRVYERCLQK